MDRILVNIQAGAHTAPAAEFQNVTLDSEPAPRSNLEHQEGKSTEQ